MYTIITRRKTNLDRQQETTERAQREFFPKLQNAPGFVGFYLVRDDDDGISTVVAVWEDKATADAFATDIASWARTLDEMGHTLVSRNHGDTVVSLEGHSGNT